MRWSSVLQRQKERLWKLKKAEYMLEHVGEEYDGVISGVTGWGFYVELPNTVEGLVHIMTLKDDYYNFDEENYRLVGEQHGRVFRLGEPVRVRVRNAEPANRTINFTYVEKETETEINPWRKKLMAKQKGNRNDCQQ